MNFSDLTLIPPLLRAVAEAGYQTPSPIQEKAIPPVLAGRDLLGCAQTGTGKTAAFALPILQLLTAHCPEGKKAIRSLILTPTRELALQIQESFETYGRHLPLRSMVIFGGVGQGPQVEQLKRGVDILVATPGRLNDLIGQGYIKLDKVEIFVLDEADRMLDMGFVQDVKKVIRFLPEKRQTLLFSATMPQEIVELANSLLHHPAKVFVTPPATTVELIEQSLYKVDKENKRLLLAELLKDPTVTSALVFTRTKHGADRVVRELAKAGVTALAIHGNKSQNARQDALSRFKSGKVRVLVATDIAARGLDINELSHVFNYDLPNIPETYVHRIGRTGRAGRGGIAVSFCMFDELPYLADIEKLIGFKVPEVADHPWPMQRFEKAEKPQQGGGQRPGRQQPAAQQAKQGRQKGKQQEKPPQREQRHNGSTGGQKPQQAPQLPPVEEQLRRPRAEAAAQKQQGAKPENPVKRGGKPQRNPKGGPRPPFDPYENRAKGQAIVYKPPVWGGGPDDSQNNDTKGDNPMSRNNRRRGGKNRGKQKPAEEVKQQPPEIKKNSNGVFDFTEEELAEDKGLKVISSSNSEKRFANFEDFLKNQ